MYLTKDRAVWCAVTMVVAATLSTLIGLSVVGCGRPWLTCKELQVGAAADAGAADAGADR